MERNKQDVGGWREPWLQLNNQAKSALVQDEETHSVCVGGGEVGERRLVVSEMPVGRERRPRLDILDLWKMGEVTCLVAPTQKY